jgi:hypothetical protein
MCAITFVRRSGSLHAAAAATPDVRSIAIPAHIGTCASASQRKDGDTALAPEPNASSALPTVSRARGENRTSERATNRATTAASGAARIRSWPASAIETPKSAATSLRIGDRTSTPDWLANRARKRTSDGDDSALRTVLGEPGEVAGADDARNMLVAAWLSGARTAMRRTRVSVAANRRQARYG